MSFLLDDSNKKVWTHHFVDTSRVRIRSGGDLSGQVRLTAPDPIVAFLRSFIKVNPLLAEACIKDDKSFSQFSLYLWNGRTESGISPHFDRLDSTRLVAVRLSGTSTLFLHDGKGKHAVPLEQGSVYAFSASAWAHSVKYHPVEGDHGVGVVLLIRDYRPVHEHLEMFRPSIGKKSDVHQCPYKLPSDRAKDLSAFKQLFPLPLVSPSVDLYHLELAKRKEESLQLSYAARRFMYIRCMWMVGIFKLRVLWKYFKSLGKLGEVWWYELIPKHQAVRVARANLLSFTVDNNTSLLSVPVGGLSINEGFDVKVVFGSTVDEWGDELTSLPEFPTATDSVGKVAKRLCIGGIQDARLYKKDTLEMPEVLECFKDFKYSHVIAGKLTFNRRFSVFGLPAMHDCYFSLDPGLITSIGPLYDAVSPAGYLDIEQSEQEVKPLLLEELADEKPKILARRSRTDRVDYKRQL